MLPFGIAIVFQTLLFRRLIYHNKLMKWKQKYVLQIYIVVLANFKECVKYSFLHLPLCVSLSSESALHFAHPKEKMLFTRLSGYWYNVNHLTLGANECPPEENDIYKTDISRFASNHIIIDGTVSSMWSNHQSIEVQTN